jgi:hypothetical protein
MRKPQAGVQPHLCLPAPLAPLAPCCCVRTPRTFPQTLNQNPRRLFASPAGNTSGMKAKNMHRVVLPRAHEMLPKHHFLHNTSCKSARNTRKPLRTMYRCPEHRQAHPLLSLHMRVRCHAALRAWQSSAATVAEVTLMTRPCIPDLTATKTACSHRNDNGPRQPMEVMQCSRPPSGSNCIYACCFIAPKWKQLPICMAGPPCLNVRVPLDHWPGIHCLVHGEDGTLFSTPFAALVSQSPPAPAAPR